MRVREGFETCCGKPVVAVVAGEEGYPVCVDCFMKHLSAPQMRIHALIVDGEIYRLPGHARLTFGTWDNGKWIEEQQ